MNSTAPVATIEQETSPRRDAVLRAALAEMVERGFHGTTMPEVAKKAGVGIGTIYRYFADKDALGNALYRQCKEALGAALWDGFPPLPGLRAQFDELWRRMAHFAQEQPLVLAFCELHHHASYLDAQSRAVEEKMLTPAIALLTQGQRDGLLRPLPAELMAVMVWGMLVALCTQAPRPFDPDIIAAAGDSAWAAIANPAKGDHA